MAIYQQIHLNALMTFMHLCLWAFVFALREVEGFCFLLLGVEGFCSCFLMLKFFIVYFEC
jgi:hypothetical protein